MKKIDELKAEIKKAEQELERLKTYLSSKKEELDMLTTIKDIKNGDYVECEIDGKRIIALLKYIEFVPNGQWSSIEVDTFGGGDFDFFNLKKWQPKKGELCLFWDKNKFIEYSIIDVFNRNLNGLFQTKSGVTWTNCIPFISEKQFKEHIGYEEC